MNTSVLAAAALAFSALAITNAQTDAPAKVKETESKLPAGVKPRRVTAAEFKKEYALVGMPQTMHYVTYLGQREGRAYINHQAMSSISRKTSDSVIYVELSELDETFRDSLPKTELKDAK